MKFLASVGIAGIVGCAASPSLPGDLMAILCFTLKNLHFLDAQGSRSCVCSLQWLILRIEFYMQRITTT